MKKPESFYIIDDDSIFHFLTKRIIMDCYNESTVASFNNGEEALSALADVICKKNKAPDIILLDISMPVLDGWQFMEEYQILQPKLKKTITIFMVSSSIDRRDEERANSIANLTAFIVKPVTKAKFIEMMKSLPS